MAAASAACIYMVGTRFLGPQRTIALAASQFLPSFSLSQLGFNHLRLRTTVPASRKLVVRAARTESKGYSLGFRAPDFELPEPLTGRVWKLTDFDSYPALLRGLAVIAISSNSIYTHPQDGRQFMAEEAKLFNYAFPYLYDEAQMLQENIGAVCTPEFLLFKKDGRRPFELVYHGQFDDSRPSNNVPVTGRDLSLARDCVLSGQPVSSAQKSSIKWHPKAKI